MILVWICSDANAVGFPPSPCMHTLIAFASSLNHTQPTSFGPQIALASLALESDKQKSERAGIRWQNQQMLPLRSATRSCSRTQMHLHVLLFPLSVSCYVFLSHSLSALTTDGVLIKSSRNRTVGKHCRVCQFHNCRGLIQPLTCCIQIGREPTVFAPTGRAPLARSWGVLQQRASL